MDEPPVTEQELQKLRNPDTEQELEVRFNAGISFLDYQVVENFALWFSVFILKF